MRNAFKKKKKNTTQHGIDAADMNVDFHFICEQAPCGGSPKFKA